MASPNVASSGALEIQGLPTEVLEILFVKVLETDVPSFFRLAQTCPRFRDVIRLNLVPQICEGKMSRAAGVALCNMIDVSVARNWLEQAGYDYRPEGEGLRSLTGMASAYLIVNTHLRTGNPKVFSNSETC